MKTAPGRLVVGSLDLAIDAGDKLLRMLQPAAPWPRKTCSTRSTPAQVKESCTILFLNIDNQIKELVMEVGILLMFYSGWP